MKHRQFWGRLTGANLPDFVVLHVLLLALLASGGPQCSGAAATGMVRNVIFILSDDHRHDFIAARPGAPAFLETPGLDRMAREGVTFANAFVSTSLCSPSRATILTGRYMHRHNVVDNQRPVPKGTVFFPSLLQKCGIATAFVGKWHMGHDSDEKQPGFDHWASFKGQGDYLDQELNVNGVRRQFKGYNSDILTDVALQWLKDGRDTNQPFYLHLAFKAPHYPFDPASRHRGRYRGKKINYPETMGNTEENYRTQPRWVRERRYSIHGVDHMETGAFDRDPVPNFDEFYWSYCEAIHSLDENIARLLAQLDSLGLSRDTLVVYTSDNGFHLGEHGFYDKRDAYETSIRVPLLAWAPGRLAAGTVVTQLVQNIDLAPAILDVLGVAAPANAGFDGRSFAPLLRGESVPWRDHILYEYHWEWNFPATPTLFALRTTRHKFIYHHGTWDQDAFYDLETDPFERHNLISVPTHREDVARLRQQLFAELEASGALNVPVRAPAGERLDQRKLPR